MALRPAALRPRPADELAGLRADVHARRTGLVTRPATFSLAKVAAAETEHSTEITTFRARREAAFTAKRERW